MRAIVDTNVVLDVLLEREPHVRSSSCVFALAEKSLIEALQSKITDFEDAILEQSGRQAGAEAIVTRNTQDFRRSSLKAFDPNEFLAVLAARG